MKIKKLIKQITKTSFVFCLITQLIATPIIPAFQTPISPKIAEAAGESCSDGGGSSPSGANLQARVGGVALDQAAKFLADMTDITGAYYDPSLDRIVFVGKTNTHAPKFNKDDLAVAIKAVIYNNTIPAVSMEEDPADPTGPNLKVLYYGGIENTKFGNILFDADDKLKSYSFGYNPNGTVLTSIVPSYRSFFDRYIDKNPSVQSVKGSSRFWITPKLITLKKDDPSQSFIFDTATMQVKTEPLNPDNDPKWNEAAYEFADDQTNNYDAYAQETPAYNATKTLGKIVSVIKWLKDNGISTDFNFARDYAPIQVSTPVSVPKRYTPWRDISDGQIQLIGGVDYYTANTYTPDNDGTSSSIKDSSQAVPTTKEDIHWTFNNNGTQYDSVAVTADAFRSLGSYSTSVKDISFPTAGDLTLAFQRSYSSYSGGQYGLGRGWNIYSATLYDNDPVHYFNYNGITYPKSLAFVSQAGGFESFTINYYNIGYVPDDPAYHSKIVRNSDGTFTVRLKDQTEVNFNSSFKLANIKDKNGNTISYNYDGTGKLATIADSKGHQITLNYSTINGQQLISSLQDWSGRTVNYTYDDQGNLLTVKDPNGNTTTYSYDANFKLTGITDREGKTIVTNTYTPEAKLATQKNAANLTTTYSHDNTNRIITVSDDLGRAQTAKYDAKARILEQKDPLNYAIQYTYGTEYAPVTIKDKRGNQITNTYDANGNLTSVTYPDTKKVTYEYDTKNRITRILDYRYGLTPKEIKYTYNTPGDLTQTYEAGLLTNYSYDTTGEMLTLTDPLSHITTWTRDNFGNKLTEKDALNNTASFEYDAIGRLNKTTDPDTKIITYTYDNNGNLLTQTNSVGTTTNTYDKESRLTRITLPDNTVTEYAYNTADSLTSVIDAMTNMTNYGYDTYQNLTSQQDALNNTTTNIYDKLNRQTQSTTPLGKVSKWEYDANGNISKRIDANNNTTNYQYDAFNRLTKISYPDTKTVAFEYDNRGNRTKMIDPIGTSTYTYDKFDRLTQAKNPFSQTLAYTYNNADLMTKITYPDGKAVTYTYNNNNRLSKATDWNYKATSYAYNKNGTLATKSLPNGIVTTYAYDSANRLIGINHKKSTTTLAGFAYERDSVGNITKASEQGTFLLQPSPIPTSTPTPTPTPTSGVTTPTPTPSTTEADLVITNVTFTPANPQPNQFFTITTTIKNQGTSRAYAPVSKITYYYDNPLPPTYDTGYNDFNNITIDLAPGQTMQEVNNYAYFGTSGAHQFYVMIDQDKYIAESDENNNLYGPVNVTLTAPTPTPTSAPTPTPTTDPNATPTPTPTPNQSGPDLVITDMTISPANPTKYQLFTVSTTVKNQGTVAISNKILKLGYYFDLSQPPSYSTTPNKTYSDTINLAPGASQVVTYGGAYFSPSAAHTVRALVDRDQALAEIDETNNAAGPATVNVATNGIFNSIFAYLGFINVAGLFNNQTAHAQESYPQFITDFTYDPLGRLTSAKYPDSSLYSYAFDNVGNRLTQAKNGEVSNYTYNTDNQLQQGGNKTYYYDNNGNQTMTAETSPLQNPEYSYDFENRLIQYVMPNGNTHNFRYDGLGNRLEKEFSTAIKRWVYDNSGPLSRLMVDPIEGKYIYGINLISQGDDFTSSREYFLEDGLGNTRFVTDNYGNKKKAYEYDPYGNIKAEDGIYDSIFQFQSQQYDDTLDLYFLRARYYDPATGRFISKDPVKGTLTIPQSQNPYAYALNNPIIYSDPSGEQVSQACYTVYQSVAANAPRYIGITNNLARRAGEHLAQKGITIEAIPGLSNLTKVDARAVEQLLIETYKLQSQGGTLLNKINSISQNNPIYTEAIKIGTQILNGIGL